MDKIVKLLAKISLKDRLRLLDLIDKLIVGDKTLEVIKIKNSDFYRLRYKNYRIIFHKEPEVVVDSVKIRNENTYKNI